MVTRVSAKLEEGLALGHYSHNTADRKSNFERVRMASIKVVQQTAVLLLLLACLWLWYLYARVATAPLLAPFYLLVWAAMTRGLLLRAKMRRHAWLYAYLQEHSALFKALRGGLIMWALSITLAALLSLILLINLLRLHDTFVWQALLLLTCSLMPIQQVLARRLSTHIKEYYRGDFAWRVAAWIGACVLMLVLCWHAFYQDYPRLSSATLEQAVWYFVDQETARNAVVLVLLQLSAGLDGFSQWLAQQFIPAPADSIAVVAAWLIILLKELAFVWSFLIVCRGVVTLNRPLSYRGESL
ncbi:MAG: hypothetical protein R3332_13465 [Pseudohongiellaceae bacterium]|nr:hypothetical protein [Pseudohongiellaceae bacterium]